MFIGPTHQLTTISGLAYMAAVVPYVRWPPYEHKLRTSVFKLMNIIQNMNVGPDEHKKLMNESLFLVVPWCVRRGICVEDVH
jgi:hypothetical protein